MRTRIPGSSQESMATTYVTPPALHALVLHDLSPLSFFPLPIPAPEDWFR